MTPMTRPLTPTQMIVETTCNHLYDVRPADGLDHVWIGTEVKRAKGGGYVPKARARPTLVRKEGSRVIAVLQLEQMMKSGAE